jgi:ABC-type glycerol-3-phosphate transport system permease component
MRGFGRWLLNSVVVTIVSTILPMVLSILAAYSFARYRFRFAGILLMLFLVPRILPRVSLIIPLFDLIRVFGLLDRYGALFLTYTASAIPLAVWLMTGFFRTVPRELEDSAKLDGANLWIRITRVIIPVAWPGVVTAAILCVREAWNEFPFVLSFMSSSSMRTLPYALYSLRDAMGIEDWARYNAFTILSILPLIAVFWVFQRRIVGSIISGSIK